MNDDDQYKLARDLVLFHFTSRFSIYSIMFLGMLCIVLSINVAEFTAQFVILGMVHWISRRERSSIISTAIAKKVDWSKSRTNKDD